MKAWTALGLAVAAIVAAFLAIRTLRSTLHEEGPDSTRTEGTGPAEKSSLNGRAGRPRDWVAPAITTKKSDSEQFVSLTRINEDPEYIKKLIRRHMSIKSYLASPLKGDPQFEGLIDWLLANGYALEDTVSAYYTLSLASSMQTIEDVREQLRRMGKPPEVIASSAEAILATSNQNRRGMVARHLHLGPEELDALETFMSLAPKRPFNPGRADGFMPSIPPKEGEPILRDDDWMSVERKGLVAAYTGPRRSTDSRDSWRPSPSPYSMPAERQGEQSGNRQ